jgi:hypothetical protein
MHRGVVRKFKLPYFTSPLPAFPALDDPKGKRLKFVRSFLPLRPEIKTVQLDQDSSTPSKQIARFARNAQLTESDIQFKREVH